MLPIRANANTTINENNPSSARELLAYYNREHIGDASIFYDSYYSETRHKILKIHTEMINRNMKKIKKPVNTLL